MGFLGEWRASRERRKRADRYLRALLTPPDALDIDWLSPAVGDRDRALRELTFLRRAVGLIVAERDALDDRTASDVAHALAAVIEGEARRSPDTGREWTARWLAYTAALAVRGQVEAPAARLARVLLEGAGATAPSAETLAHATHFVQTTRANANEALRAVFGVATLPDDVRPSALRS